MLERLQIENFALIDQLTLEFSGHLNILTGETGAGKSILIDALRFVLGERADGLRLGSREETCRVEAVFAPPSAILSSEKISQFMDPEDSVLILRREYSSEGRSRAWVNNRAVNQSALKEVGDLLVDIHGQYDHQQLLRSASHLDWIDRFAQTESLKKEYQDRFAEYALLAAEKEKLDSLEQSRDREMDLLKYQIDEISRVEPVENEEEDLQHEKIRMANSEKLYESSAQILKMLEEEENSVSDILSTASRSLTHLAKLDPSQENLKSDYENVQLGLEEILRKLRDYRETLSFEPERLEEVEKRLDLLDLLKRKYGGSVSKVIEFFREAKAKYNRLENSQVYKKEAEQKIQKIAPELEKLCEKLTEKRKKAAAAIKKTIENELQDLGIPNAEFGFQIERTDFTASGRDKIEFLIKLNPGHPLLPLHEIVSAGEVSRVMLAMKKALMKADPVPTLIFDEIDANIGGRLGTVTGEKVKEISRERQVLLITHLPQIASFADRHFKVLKSVRQGKTFTQCRVIEGDEKVRELAQMMSGKDETEISRRHAEEMLTKTKK